MQLHDFRRIHPLIAKTAAITLTNSFIHYRLYYCNNLFQGLHNYSIQNLQRFKIQLLALSFVVSVHHTSFRFINICIDYLLIIVLTLRFVASFIVLCLYMNLIILVLCSAFGQILIPFVLPLFAHYYYHTSTKNHVVFVHFHMLHLVSGITYLLIFVL